MLKIGKTNFRGENQVFGIKEDDRRRHIYLVGGTGMGKSTLLENMVIQDIQEGRGVCFIDVHGDSAQTVLNNVPSHRTNDVILFRPSDKRYPIALNVMESNTHKHLIASGLVGVFKKIWADSWGPRLEHILRNTILALLDYPGATLLDVLKMYTNDHFRNQVLTHVKDSVVKEFWTDEFGKWNMRFRLEAIAPIQNKIGQFLSDPIIRNIVAQKKSSFDIRWAMDGRKILIVDLSKGRLGEDNSALLGAMLINKIQIAAMSRADITEEERQDFYLYVDEFQNFSTESFVNILSEARKYRLNLIMANQYIAQLEEEIRDAIFGNCGTVICFKCGVDDAEHLEKEFNKVFEVGDIINLPKYHIYLRLMINGVSGNPFSATTLPPVVSKKSNAENIIKTSRQRYSRKLSNS